ncbi:uncharacterized protein SGFS_002040 [Streptomyces graminofaciens]|uniref:Aminoglycoside phosphotransferase domain-containing protein n=1 Tax=Streptomyces graminofaciens TaxID=68212 RepID=A0ABN5V6G6_9ACTN|nr:hypothetical protein [Streptomyces graminofaciens]BBC28913.1 uncharacterized protein SGFS_002040 [Streptomyces graminofaciens]
MSAPEDKASGKSWDGALDAQHAFGDLDGRRPALLGVADAFDDGHAYRSELSARVDEPVLSDDPILRHDLRLPWDPGPAVTCWTSAHADLHRANVTAPLKVLDWEGWGRAPEGFDGATLYAYSLLQPDAAARVRDAFPILGSPAGLAAEATVCAQLLQTVARGDNLVLEDQLRNWAEEPRHR